MTLTDKEVEDLLVYLLDQPAKFSNPLINFIEGKRKAQIAETKETAKEEIKK